MSKLRHWKERWDPHADLVFLKPVLLEGKKVTRGDPVTPEMRQKLGLHRLRRWWEARYVAHSLPPSLDKKPPEGLAAHPNVQVLKRGWYGVTLPDGSIKKARKKDLASLLLLVDGERLRNELDV